jgi:carbamate kinase
VKEAPLRIVAALGGNALLRPGEPLEAGIQRQNAERAAAALLPLAAGHELVVTHGNGPQVGLLALESGLSGAAGPYPLDVLGAESQGMIGYLLGVALRSLLPGRSVVTVLTDVEVDAADPAFAAPTKPVGPLLTTAEAVDEARARGWHLAPDRGAVRRVVPSPEPLRVLEAEAIATLAGAGALVIAAGGGGIPLVCQDGRFRGVEAVVDKDLTSALLARELGADLLLLLTDVPGVFADGRVLRRAPPRYLRSLGLPAGSMGPKAEAACRFVEAGRGRAAIGAIEDAARIARGEAGTEVAIDAVEPEFHER